MSTGTVYVDLDASRMFYMKAFDILSKFTSVEILHILDEKKKAGEKSYSHTYMNEDCSMVFREVEGRLPMIMLRWGYHPVVEKIPGGIRVTYLWQ